jgi:hypothetical protein
MGRLTAPREGSLAPDTLSVKVADTASTLPKPVNFLADQPNRGDGRGDTGADF